jgi:hypothetical protein
MPFLNYVLNMAGHHAHDYQVGTKINLYGTDYVVRSSTSGTPYFDLSVIDKKELTKQGIIIAIVAKHYIVTYDEVFDRMMAEELNMLKLNYHHKFNNVGIAT